METQTMEPRRKPGSEIPAPRPKKRKKSHFLRNTVILLLIAAAAVVIWFGSRGPVETVDAGSTYTVQRGDLLVSVVEGGNLKAKRSVEVTSKVEGRATIVYLVPEGTYVKQGDLLVELDAAELDETATREEIEYESDYASWFQAKENLAIQLNQNESDITAGELNVEFAKKELDKYNLGGWPLELSKLENDITIAEEELKRAEDQVKWTKELHDKGFVTREELEGDLLAEKKSRIKLEQAREEKRLAEIYDQPMQLRRLESDLEEAKRELERIKRRAESETAQKEADKKSRKAQLDLQKERRDKAQEQLANAIIKAPQDGLVVYGSQDRGDRHGMSENQNVEEGAEVRFRQTLITLPDVSVMVVDTDVHESAVDKVQMGMEAMVTVDAFPDLQLHGKVTKVAILPDSQSRWLNPDLKVYSTEVTLDDGNGKLKPGMSAKVEIICDRLRNVISVPVQSVYRRGGREVCYVVNGGGIEVRPVTVGLDNERFVEIKSGLEAGEDVLLYPPTLGDDVGDEEKAEEGEEEEHAPDGMEEPDGMTRRPALTEGQGEERRGPGGPGGRRGQMSPEMMKEFERIRNLPQEERRAAMEKLRAEGKIPASFGGGREGFGSREGNGSREGRGRDRGSRNRDSQEERQEEKKSPGENEE